MKKLLLSLLCLAGLSASAATVTDVITAESLVGDPNYSATSTSYASFSVTGESGAEYALQCAHNKGAYLQFRSANNNSGLVATKSVGKVTNVTITWAANTAAARVLNIYGYDEAIATPAGLYGTGAPSLSGSLKMGTASFDFTDAPAYVGMRSASGAMYIDKIEITWETAGDAPVIARPEFSVESGDVEAGTKVELTCETEGAEIYYTLDGTTPDNTSTKYTEAITINTTTTVKAIAYVGEDASSVATAVYTVVELMSIEDVLALSNNEQFAMGTELVVVYVNSADTRYNYVYADGHYALVYSTTNLNLQIGDVIAKGWTGAMSYYNGLPELTPAGAVTTTGETGTLPEFKTVDAAAVSPEMVNSLIVIKNVEFAAATPDATNSNFTGTVGATELNFRNTYKLAAEEAGVYNVTCAVSIYTKGATTLGTDLQLVPVKYETASSGIADIEADNNAPAVYYNLQGVRVMNPENGL